MINDRYAGLWYVYSSIIHPNSLHDRHVGRPFFRGLSFSLLLLETIPAQIYITSTTPTYHYYHHHHRFLAIMSTACVTGANRGIGLEVKALSSKQAPLLHVSPLSPPILSFLSPPTPILPSSLHTPYPILSYPILSSTSISTLTLTHTL